MPKSHFNILQYQFPVTLPYSEGHVLSAHEAGVLNHYRSESIRKICRRWVIDAAHSSPNQILSIEELAKLSHRIATLDESYEFSPREEPPPSILEHHLTMVANQIIKTTGIHPDQLESIKSRPEVQRRAREIITAGTMSLADLLS